MNLAHLKYAVEVEKTGSITKAAENLFMGQPNLSKAIKELEAQVGIAIFRRTSRGVAPTRKGEEFLARAKAILCQIEEMEAIYRPDDGRIRFHICIPRAGYLSLAFARFVRELNLKSPMEITLREADAMEAIASVAESESTLGMIRYEISQEAYYQKQLEERSLEGEPLWEFEPLVLCSIASPLAGEEMLSMQALQDGVELLCGEPQSTSAGARRMQEERQNGRCIGVYERASQLNLLAQVPEAYLWASPLPAQELARFGLVQRRCQGAERCRDVLIFQKGYRPTEIDQAFLQKVKQLQAELAAGEKR